MSVPMKTRKKKKKRGRRFPEFRISKILLASLSSPAKIDAAAYPLIRIQFVLSVLGIVEKSSRGRRLTFSHSIRDVDDY
ncbi:hypothetical protein BDN72DRAFT_832055 [Pluteus cervinus]|uniref:Uncharacterized protein n=1 Tax=Pluteus cervinus TaxID=181527 RepID=A0ACD3BDP4_9AGAR|nr:hypothetical protein BDN72DRAFT_832055 [Pluteus cervinus]